MPARLYHERIVRVGVSPEHWLLLTHGIYGAGSNWRGIARKVHERRPDWGIVLVDLRQHGRSEPGTPPHTLAACADDLRALVTELGITALAGHSFGGKVVLATRPLVDVVQTWVLDASPSARPGALDEPANTVGSVLGLLEHLDHSWARREDFVQAVVAAGHDLGLAQWLAMNVVPDDAGTLTLRLDVAALREMLTDYYAQDLWSIVWTPGTPIEIVLATRGSSVSDADRARLATAPSHVHVHEVVAGHWLHIDAPAAVVDLFANLLP